MRLSLKICIIGLLLVNTWNCRSIAAETDLDLDEQFLEVRLFREAFPIIRDYLVEGEVLISPEILAKAELGDHFETINVDRPDFKSAFGNPGSHLFASVRGKKEEESEGGTYGVHDGGGRRLMVTRQACDLTKVIVACARAGFMTKVKETAPAGQIEELKKQIKTLGSFDEKLREQAFNVLLGTGMSTVNLLTDAFQETKDDRLQTRIRLLSEKIQLQTAVNRFRKSGKGHPLK